jgi:predicted GIY-YIG superfamily endonuclease
MTESMSVEKFNSNLIKSEPPAIYLYVLRLRSPPGEPPRYYVGSALDYEERLRAHFAGEGAAYTRRYPPAELVELRRGDRFDEDSMTRRLMSEHGIEYVRGGAYTRVVLSPEDTASLQLEIRAAAGLCTNCGRAGHFAVACRALGAPPVAQPATAPVRSYVAAAASVLPKEINEINDIIRCDRCGRNGHPAEECRTAAENIYCTNCHRRGHRTDECRIIKQEISQNKPIYTCFRCGCRGHTSNVCANKYDRDGEIAAYNKYYPKDYVRADKSTNWRQTSD